MRPLFLLLLCLIAPSCNLEPPVPSPCVEITNEWRIDANKETTLANVRWWEQLEDPVLNDLIYKSLNNNKDLKIAIWRVCEFVAKYQVALSPLFPQIDFQSTALKQKFPSSAFFPPGFNPITPEYSYLFSASYEIDFWGQISSAAHAAYEEALAEVENRRTVVLTLVSAVAKTYIRLRELDLELEIGFKTLESRKESLLLAQERFKGGLTSEIEVTQAASLYEEALATVIQLEEEIPKQENLLSTLIGEPPSCIVRGKALEALPEPVDVPAGLPSELLQRRPDIKRAEDQLFAATAQIGVARAAFFPQITLTGFYGAESFQLKQLFTSAARMWQYAANLLQPIFTGGRLTGQLKEAEAIRWETFYNYQQTVLNAFREVEDALIAHAQAKELIPAQEGRVSALREYLKLAWLRYDEGQTDYLTFLDAERQLYRAELDLARAQGNLYLTLVDLYKALGGGWVTDADDCLREGGLQTVD